MSHSKKKWKGRAQDASAEMMFEHALFGEDRPSRKAFDPRADRKTQQLCQQVRRALMLALAGECDDDALREAYVDSVEPIGNASQLLVRVAVPFAANLNPAEVLARLNARARWLRAQVAQSISRKRVPGLSFMAIPPSPQQDEGGQP